MARGKGFMAQTTARAALILSAAQEQSLRALAALRTASVREAQRAKILLGYDSPAPGQPPCPIASSTCIPPNMAPGSIWWIPPGKWPAPSCAASVSKAGTNSRPASFRASPRSMPHRSTTADATSPPWITSVHLSMKRYAGDALPKS